MYNEKAICVDCGREFTQRTIMQIRCPECQEEHRRKYDRERRQKQYALERQIKTQKKLEGAVYINGHPQVCTHMGSCFYGSQTQNGCSYALEEHQTRRSQGYFIVDGKCPAYEKKGRKRKRQEMYAFVDKPSDKIKHNYGEV